MATIGSFASASLQFGLDNTWMWELQMVLAKLPRGLGGLEKERARELGVDGQWRSGGSGHGAMRVGSELLLLI
jgi:hypothetical protein